MKARTPQQEQEHHERIMQSHLEANRVKDIMEEEGYTFAWSLYGIVTDKETHKPMFRRIEVFSDGIPKREAILQIKQLFTNFPPLDYYSIWAYNLRTNKIVFINGWS